MSLANLIAMLSELVEGQRAAQEDDPLPSDPFVAIDTSNAQQRVEDVNAALDAWEAAMQARETCPHGAVIARAAGGWYCLDCGRWVVMHEEPREMDDNEEQSL